jgi:hypothetical protein
MKIAVTVVALAVYAALLIGCSTSPAGSLVYRESQFDSRLEYLRFCQLYELQTRRCE